MRITVNGAEHTLRYTIGRMKAAGLSGLQDVGKLLEETPNSFDAVQRLVNIGAGSEIPIDDWTLQDIKGFIEALTAELQGQDPTPADGSISGPSAGTTSA